jgi:hypothetical protein
MPKTRFQERPPGYADWYKYVSPEASRFGFEFDMRDLAAEQDVEEIAEENTMARFPLQQQPGPGRFQPESIRY